MGENKFNFNPSKGRYLIRVQEIETTSAGGILLAPASLEDVKSKKGVIVASGGDYRHSISGSLIEMEYSVGDEVLFNSYVEHSEKLASDEEYIVTKCENVLGKFN